jgi:hypothetical protein
MSIKRLGRPTGYDYPTGLNITTPAGPTSIEYLIVAGGGGGGAGRGGGGGAGGYLTGTSFAITRRN